MIYVLTYAWDGHELAIKRDSLDEITNAIRDLYDAHGSVTILRIEEDHDGPRTWAIEYPPVPPAGTRMRIGNGARSGEVLTMGTHDRIQTASGMNYSWTGVLEEFGPLTEVVETEVEAAARRLREARTNRPEFRYWQTSHADDIRTVLEHVLNGGQL